MSNDEPMELGESTAKHNATKGNTDEKMDQSTNGDVESATPNAQQWRSTILNLLGLQPDAENKAAKELTSNTDALRKLHSSVNELTNDEFFDQGVLKIKFDEIISECFANVFSSTDRAEVPQSEVTLGRYFHYEAFDTVATGHPGILLKYVFRVFKSCQQYLRNGDIDEGSEGVFKFFQKRLLANYLMELRGFSAASDFQDAVVAAFVRVLYLSEFPANFLQLLIDTAITLPNGNQVVKEAFDPVLTRIRYCAEIASVLKIDFLLHPYYALNRLLDLKANGCRPICNLIVSRDDFCPKLFSDAAGLEFARRSFFGPFLGKSVAEVNGGVNHTSSIERFSGIANLSTNDSSRFMFYSRFQNILASCRIEVHKAFHSILVNGAATRNSLLEYVSQLLKHNSGKSMIQVDAMKTIDDGFMVNFLSVMLHLSEKITLDKVRTNYIFHPKCRLNLVNETRMNADYNRVEQLSKQIEFVEDDLKFTTECFFLTIQSLRLGLNATIESFRRVKREASELNDGIRQIERQISNLSAQNPLMSTQFHNRLKGLKNYQQKTLLHLVALECLLTDESMLGASMRFITKQLNFLCLAVDPNYNSLSEHPAEAPQTFAMLPEFMLETILDVLTFALKSDSKILQGINQDFTHNFLIFLCNSQYFKNPFLMAKIVDIMFLSCSVRSQTGFSIFQNLTQNNYAYTHLFPQLVKFYGDVETTGASTEFYDKFNIRRSIQVIFQVLWRDTIYRSRMIETAKNNSTDFVRFINMIINDATFLLDESLSGLKKIHDIEELIANEAEFSKLSEEDKKAKNDALEESSRLVRSWIVLGNETMELFIQFTRDAPDVFLTDVLGDRIAAIFVAQSALTLKVKDPERFHYDPRNTLQQVISVYLNLNSAKFAEFVAFEERSYSPEKFDDVLTRLRNTLSAIDYEKFANLCDASKIKI
ncbi:U-box domain-containing protein [Aphelenchoides bicaudatus]|nr:U-box domain-containing protein [Aphelenchoides bicaudatus]